MADENAKLVLMPHEAAASIAVRIRRIAADEAYVKAVVARYDGLKAFDAELQKHGVSKEVLEIIKKG